jgi:uncharacterized membrane protein YbhN (UPF0104 family)
LSNININLKRIKAYLRWIIFGGTLFFILKSFKDHWDEVATVRINSQGWILLSASLILTLLAHIWSAWVWGWLLKLFKQPLDWKWLLRVYLMTNLAKYLPGNVWHFYGRISAITKTGGSVGVASLSVLLEPLLMASAALLIALISGSFAWIKLSSYIWLLGPAILGLIAVLLGIQPTIINPIIQRLGNSKGNSHPVEIKKYPLFPLLGEVGFVLLRAGGFLLAWIALLNVLPGQIPLLISAFSFAWLLGLVVPGAPGGMGVFEATIIATLGEEKFPIGVVLTVVSLFRIISILAEVLPAGVAWLLLRDEL